VSGVALIPNPALIWPKKLQVNAIDERHDQGRALYLGDLGRHGHVLWR
jgi:hypothetical protein